MARDNLKWPPLPEQLYDKKKDTWYTVGKLLGGGGFAKCYLATQPSGTRLACKVVLKESLKSEKHREKLKSEIKINDKLAHHHIVRLHSCFQDTTYVYIMLELCENQSLVDLLKSRKRLSEEEARYYMGQMLDAMEYCHESQVIHRDLKLGNVFLDSKMHVKIGDFGLAAELVSDDERKKTICGTPNYIAPEVLYDSKNGHDYKADIWSLGVMLYTLVIGIPPFQTRDTNEIYRKIRVANFQFPAHVEVTNEFKDCVRFILTTDPKDRPTIEQIRKHPFFAKYKPKVMPVSTLHTQPDFTNEIREHNLNLTMTKIEAADSASKATEQKTQTNQSTSSQLKRKPFVYQMTPSKKRSIVSGSIAESTLSKSERLAFLTLPDMSNYSFLETTHFNINQALEYIRKFKTVEDLDRLSNCDLQVPVFITKWIDQGSKYGLGYQLTDETAGVFFKDLTTMVHNSAEAKFQYLYYKSGSTRYSVIKECYSADEIPQALAGKTKLLEKYRDYMRDHLSSSVPTVPFAGSDSLVYLTKFARTHDAVMFRLSSKTIQINFNDHYKVIISEEGRVVTLVHPTGKIDSFKMVEIFSVHFKVSGSSQTDNTEDVYYRLKYVQDMLQHIIKKKQTVASN